MKRFYLDDYIYVCYDKPEGTHLPAIMHIHGGGQTANEQWVEYFKNLGFACISFDWGGDWKREDRVNFTKYPPNLEFGNQLLSGGPQSGDLFRSCWYQWFHISLRVLQYLKSDPDVDADNIGVFGISMGGSLTWNVAAAADIKACAPIYGIGFNPNVHPLMEPAEAARRVSCPTMILSASNDMHGRGDCYLQVMNRMTCPKWLGLSENTCHHIEYGMRDNLKVFFEHFLMGKGEMPDAPQVRFECRDGKIYVNSNVTDFKVFSATGERDVFRFYRQEQDCLTVVDPEQMHYVYITKEFSPGFSLSSPIVPVLPAALGGVKTSEKLTEIFDIAHGLKGLGGLRWATDPLPATWENRFILEKDSRGALIHPDHFYILNALADERTIDAAGIELEFQCDEAAEAEIAFGAHVSASKPYSEYPKVHSRALKPGTTVLQIRDDFTHTPIIRIASDKEIRLVRCTALAR